MVYVYVKASVLQQHIGKQLSVDEITDALVNLGMDVKAVSPELKIEITSEKADMISAVGIARAIKYYLGMEQAVPRYDIGAAKEKIVVKDSVADVRPRTVAAIVRGMQVTPDVLDAIIAIQEKIHDSFGRDRKKCAIGIYPVDAISFPVTYTAEAPENIQFHPLQADTEMDGATILAEHPTGRTYAHLLAGHNVYPVFRDATGAVLSMPPIINSVATGKVDAQHNDLFVECTGFNQHLLDSMLKVLVTTLVDMGGVAEAVTVTYSNGEKYSLDLSNVTDTVSLAYINKLIGIDIDAAQAKKLLANMMYGVTSVDNDTITVEIPCFRSDVWHASDIADDVARAYGYNNIVPSFPNIASVGAHLPFSLFCEQVSQTLVGLRCLELYTYLLCSSEYQFSRMLLEPQEHVKLEGSADAGTNMCRVRILPEMLRSLHINRQHKYPQFVFENGFVIVPDADAETGARDDVHLCVCLADPKSNYTQIKSVLDLLFSLLGITFSVSAVTLPYLIEGRSGSVAVNDVAIGFVGELHPHVLDNFGLLVAVSCFEINLSKLFALRESQTL